MVTGKVESVAEASKPTGVALWGFSIYENSDKDQEHEATRKREDSNPMLAEKLDAPYPEDGGLDSLLQKQSSSLKNTIIREVIVSGRPRKLRLMFTKKLSLPIFTGSKVLDSDGNPITIVLVRKIDPIVPARIPDPIQLEVVLLHGDFPFKDNEDWTSEEFESHVVKEGRQSFLTGELKVTLRDGIATIEDIEFTDNSSWIRSRKFKVAVRVAPGNSAKGERIREGVTEAFGVYDHPHLRKFNLFSIRLCLYCYQSNLFYTFEAYEKHYPPMLHDEVWRLEKIWKDGTFHKRLSKERINTVQDFLKLLVHDPHKLRKVLGNGMSEKMWNATIKHAKSCNMGNKLYVYRGPHFTIFLSPICQLVKAVIDEKILSPGDLLMKRSYIEYLVREAYSRWSTLEEIDAPLNEDITLLDTR
ncbi:hypothetical protein L6164_036141 [Bauhinia variegata]|uniref:Uncharacterized protein n=1 Tax=Bauhinia variegata TaxID=167791 RepID=A0ACB9KG62_BAUVA|nr:hypothetical protein L6164_036141 [Bauhinia variegata]